MLLDTSNFGAQTRNGKFVIITRISVLFYRIKLNKQQSTKQKKTSRFVLFPLMYFNLIYLSVFDNATFRKDFSSHVVIMRYSIFFVLM